MRRAVSSLVVGERVVSRCDDGLLQAEYCLFDPEEVVLSADRDGEVREHGYLTSARLARARLLDLRIDARLADDAFAALRPSHRRALARTPDVLRAVEQLGPYEAFEGGVFHAATGRYAGVWLDLDALARACPLRGAATLFQVMHLLLVLEEVEEDAPVRLLTAGATRACWPGTRTWRGQALERIHRLPGVLRAMRLPTRAASRQDPVLVRGELLRCLRERATAAKASVPRLLGLAALLGRDVPARGARASAAPSLLAEDPALERIDDLRRHVDLLHGEERLHAVAQVFSSQAARAGSLPEIAVVAARAWLATGEPGQARQVARRVPSSENVTLLSSIPIPLTREREPPTVPRMRAALTFPRAAVEADPADIEGPVDAPDASEPHLAAACEPLTLPRLAVPARSPGWVPGARRTTCTELVETLATPERTPEDLGDGDETPGARLRMRIAMTRLARELGRDYRIWYGTRLVADVTAIDEMQRHLRRRFAGAELDDRRWPELEMELMRHGALLSEVLARTLDAEWVDVSGQPDDWTMIVPGTGARGRVAPIARMRLFFLRGYREPDLVAFYADVEAARAMAS